MSPVRHRVWDGANWTPFGGQVTPDPDPEPVALRNAAEHPLLHTAFWNMPIGDGAVYEDSTDPITESYLTPSVGKPALNWITYTLAYWVAQPTDPDVLFVMEDQNGVPTGETWTFKAPYSQALSAEVDDPTLNPDSVLGLYDINGLYHEFYKSKKVGNNTLRVRRHLIYNLKASSGWPTDPPSTSGIRAAHWAWRFGMMTNSEISSTAATKPAIEAIPHALAMALPLDSLGPKPSQDFEINPATGQPYLTGYRYPAYGVDSHGEAQYTGLVPGGTLLAIPRDIDLTTRGYTYHQLKVAYALQNYGARVGDASKFPTIYAVRGANDTICNEIKAAWQGDIWKLLRRVENDSPSTIGGPGNRVRPLAPANFL